MSNVKREITMKLPRMKRKLSTCESDVTHYSDSASGMTDDEVSALKYRRMRDLNNEASKRCRENRKQKMETAEHELNQLQERNIQLKETLSLIETRVAKLKSSFLRLVQNPGHEIAAARRRQLGQRLNIDPDIVGAFMNSNSNVLPDVNSFWST